MLHTIYIYIYNCFPSFIALKSISQFLFCFGFLWGGGGGGGCRGLRGPKVAVWPIHL